MKKQWWNRKRHSNDSLKKEEPVKSCNPTCHEKVWLAYERLVTVMQNKKALKSDMMTAMEEVVGYLGEVLE